MNQISYVEMIKKYLMILLTCFFFLCVSKTYALVFNILPNGTLPTTVPVGGSVFASYIIQNNTTTQRNNNFIKYLPLNVSVLPDGCGSNFNLAPNGQSGDRCLLNLQITGAVNANDPDATHHLFACFPGGLACAGTLYPLSVTQTPVVLNSIVILPINTVIKLGTGQQFIAFGFFSDGSTKNLTSSVTWKSSNQNVATINHQGIALGKQAGTTMISATFGSTTSHSATLTVKQINLNSILVTPLTSSIKTGTKIRYKALGQFADGTTVDITPFVIWRSSDITVATIDDRGIATGKKTGSTNITAQFGTVTSNSSLLNVATINLNSIVITPVNTSINIGITQQFIATGFFSDGTTQDITMSVFWKSSDSEVATINNEGLATGLKNGSAYISARFAGVTSNLSTLTVTPITLTSITITQLTKNLPIIRINGTLKYVAVGNFSDGSKKNISNLVTWNSSDETVATINDQGIATGVGKGVTTISAYLGSFISNSETLIVTPATLASITISPLHKTSSIITIGKILRYSAIGNFSDGSQQNLTNIVMWNSSNDNVATINNFGIVTGERIGIAQITARLGAITSNTSTVIVTPALLVSITITPINKSEIIPVGGSTRYAALGTFSDGSISDISLSVDWTSSNTTVASISTTGIVVGLSVGTTTITAQSGSLISNSALLSVRDAILTSINIRPINSSIGISEQQQYTAFGHYSNNTIQNITTSVRWNSSNKQIASINGNGLARAKKNTGMSSITAQLDSKTSNEANLSVVAR